MTYAELMGMTKEQLAKRCIDLENECERFRQASQTQTTSYNSTMSNSQRYVEEMKANLLKEIEDLKEENKLLKAEIEKLKIR